MGYFMDVSSKHTGLPVLIAVILVLGLFGFAIPFDDCDGHACEEAQTLCVDACCSLTADLPAERNLITANAITAHAGNELAGGGILLTPDIFRPPCA
jgi:hypothetical protein